MYISYIDPRPDLAIQDLYNFVSAMEQVSQLCSYRAHKGHFYSVSTIKLKSTIFDELVC